MTKLVIFQVEGQKFAIPLNNTERVIRITYITPLADTPDFIMGTINLQGEIIPAIDLRKIFKINNKEININDQFVIIKIKTNKVAIWVDKTEEVKTCKKEKILNAKKFMVGNNYFNGLINLDDDIILIQDPDKILTAEQILLLQSALNKVSKLK